MRFHYAFAIAAVIPTFGCTNDGNIDWRGGEWRPLAWQSYQTMTGAHGYAPAVARNSSIYLVGGGTCAGAITNTDYTTFSRTGKQGHGMLPLPSARAAGGAVLLDDRVFYAGGCSGNAALDEIIAYDFRAAVWSTPLAPMPTARYGFAMARLGKEIYTAGGATLDAGAPLDLPGPFEVSAGEALDEWRTLPRLPTERVFAGGAAVDGKFYVIGGQNAAGTVFHDAVEIYDPETQLWSTGAPLPTARSGGGASVLEGRIVVIGGLTASGQTDAVDIYDPHRDEWTSGPAMPETSGFVWPGVIRSRIVVAGGIGPGGAQSLAVRGLLPEDSLDSASQPNGWQGSSGGGPGPGSSGPQQDDGGDCSVAPGGSSTGVAAIAMALVALAAHRRRTSR